jgi:hypothetical protein
MTSSPIPTLADITAVRLAVSVEVWPHWPDGRAITDPDALLGAVQREMTETAHALRNYLAPILNALAEDDDRRHLIDAWDEVEIERSKHDSEILCLAGTAHLTVTPQEWRQIADGYSLDLDWTTDEDGFAYRTSDLASIPALPKDGIVQTLGILDADGVIGVPVAMLPVIPAVAIEHTDEGWDDFSYQPTLVTSFYVALALQSGECPSCERAHPEVS